MVYQGEKWVYMNPASETISGYPKQELMQKKFWEIVAPDHREMIKQRGMKRQKGEAVDQGYEFKIITKQKEEKWVFLNGKVISYKDKPAGLITIIDIDKTKKQSIAITKNNEKLKQAREMLTKANENLNIKNKELHIAINKAKESDRLKSAFLDNMSHEIRTPMNAIIGFAELISESYNEKETIEFYSKTISEQSQYLLKIINNIIDISKIEANQIDMYPECFSIKKLLYKYADLYTDLLSQQSKELVKLNIIEDSNDIENIYCDKNRINQIITNLLENAIKYTKKGKITIRYTTNKNSLTISVSDTGIGISDKDIKVIFDPFSIAKHSKINLQKGTGLGLSIAKNLVELMGGKIWVESEINKGSKFYFTIPIRNCPDNK